MRKLYFILIFIGVSIFASDIQKNKNFSALVPTIFDKKIEKSTSRGLFKYSFYGGKINNFKGNIIFANKSWYFVGECDRHWINRLGGIQHKVITQSVFISYEDYSKLTTINIGSDQLIYSKNEVKIIYDIDAGLVSLITLVNKKAERYTYYKNGFFTGSN